MINLHPARFVNKRTSSYSISDRTLRSVTCTISKHIIKSMHAPKKIKTIYNFWTDAEYVGFVSVINATYIIFKCIIKIICVMKKLKAVYSNIERTQHTDVACGTVHLYVHSRETKVRWWRRPYRYIFRFHACGAHGQGSATVVDWPSLSWPWVMTDRWPNLPRDVETARVHLDRHVHTICGWTQEFQSSPALSRAAGHRDTHPRHLSSRRRRGRHYGMSASL